MKSNKNILLIIFLFLILIVFVWYGKRNDFRNMNTGNNFGQNQQTRQFNKSNCLSDDCLAVEGLNYPAGEINAEAKDSLDKAINDEYRAYSFYEKVIKKFGNQRPFAMIIRAEEQHILMLKAIYDKYGLRYPENNWTEKISSPETLKEACQVGVDAEIANAKLYRDDLLFKASGYEDITFIFTNLMNASFEKHLPAFERCN